MILINIIFLLLSVSAGRLARADAAGCVGAMLPEHARLVDALAHAVGQTQAPRANSKLARVDADLVGWTSAQMRTLTPGQRDKVLSVLEDRRLGASLDIDSLQEFQKLDGAHAHLSIDEERIVLVMDVFEQNTEAARFNVRHELTHLIRMVEDGPWSNTFAKMQTLYFDRPNGVLFEEGLAIADDYQNLRRNYGPADVARLLKNSRRGAQLIVEAERRGIITRPPGDAPHLDLSRVRTDRDEYLLFTVMAADAERRLCDRIRASLRMTEAQFVEAALPQYLDKQKEIDEQRDLEVVRD